MKRVSIVKTQNCYYLSRFLVANPTIIQKTMLKTSHRCAIVIKKHVNEENPSKLNQIVRGLKILNPK
jgi:hypothetical protein